MTLKVAEMLKAAGYDRYDRYSYWDGELTDVTPGYALENGVTSQDNYWDFQRYYAPTLSDAVQWCFDKYNYSIEYHMNIRFDKYNYSIEYHMNIPESGEFDGCYVFAGIVVGSQDYKRKVYYVSKQYQPTINKALADALTYFLENLIYKA